MTGESDNFEMLRKEIARREAIIYDQLIGQSPEDPERHYRLIGQQEAFRGLETFINNIINTHNNEV